MLVDCGWIGEQPIEGHEGGNGREKCEECKEDHTRRNRQDAILVNLLVKPPKYVLPAEPGNLPGCFGVAAAQRFGSPHFLQLQRLMAGRFAVSRMLMQSWLSPSLEHPNNECGAQQNKLQAVPKQAASTARRGRTHPHRRSSLPPLAS